MKNNNIDWCIVMGLHETVKIIDGARLDWYNTCDSYIDVRQIVLQELLIEVPVAQMEL
jgi:hypothetical protein